MFLFMWLYHNFCLVLYNNILTTNYCALFVIRKFQMIRTCQKWKMISLEWNVAFHIHRLVREDANLLNSYLIKVNFCIRLGRCSRAICFFLNFVGWKFTTNPCLVEVAVFFFKTNLAVFPCSLAGACMKLDVAFSNQTHKLNVMPNNRQVFLMDHSHKTVKLQRTKSIHDLITNYGKKRKRKPKHVTEK